VGRIILINGRIMTLDDARPSAGALVVGGDRIAYVGEPAGALAYRTPETQVIDLGGMTAIPGFNDNHLHAVATGDYFSKPNLQGLDCDEIIEKLLASAPLPETTEPIYAFGWDYPDCPDPHRRLLDRHFPQRPVALFQYSGHAVWVNTAFLKKLKVTDRSPDPPGGKIERDAQGRATGILQDKAAFPVHFKRFLRMNLKAALRTELVDRALALFRENGITSIQDNTWFPMTVTHYKRLKRRGKLTARVSCWSYGELGWARYWLEHKRFDPLQVRRGPRKFFIDGTFSTRTALLTAPYRGESENFGLPSISSQRLVREIRKAIRQGRQLALHAIGDGAIGWFLDSLENVKANKQRVRELRFRLEHAQLIAPQDFERLADWGILLAVQPSAMIDFEKDRRLLGEERARRAYPLDAILKAGIPLSFGSDVPGESRFRPLELIHLAVNRQAGESIPPLAALRAYTRGSAFAEFMESEKGRLMPGQLADITVLSEDPTRCAAHRIRDIRTAMTLTGGRIVFREEPAPAVA
jgi:hypothetical protein